MLGAIIGDVIGSRFEWNNIKTKDFELFHPRCTFTDDSVMTLAVAEAIMNGGAEEDFINAMKDLGRRYPDRGYGGRFHFWLFSDLREPYYSWGNGSAMRVSPCGWLPEDQVGMFAERSAIVTHNHPEGIKGAMAVADAIAICRNDRDNPTIEQKKAAVRARMEHVYFYDLSRTLDEIRPVYRFNESCQRTVPEAVTAFLESYDYEDAVRNAVSIGGDSDTLACITGSIAEAAYGIPEDIAEKGLSYLTDDLRDILSRWQEFIDR